MNNKVRKEVKTAYNESTRNLNFRASNAVSINDAVAIMTEALEIENETTEGYNNFAPTLLRSLPEGTKVTLAREGSVCAYIKSPKPIHNTARLIKAMKIDEWHPQADGTIRLWWD